VALLTAGAARLPAALDWAHAGRAMEGEPASGDLHVVEPTADGAMLAVIDGLGHGAEAAETAALAGRVLAEHAGEPPDALLLRCHEALAGTRGAVATVAALDVRLGRLTLAGVGNVETVLLRRSGDGYRPVLVEPFPGILGHRMPALRTSTLSLAAGDLLVLATDGIALRVDGATSARESARSLATAILAEQAVPGDDALVLVARYLGAG